MESDADRLASIKALGGLLVSVRGQAFWAIVDNDFALSNGMVESSGPALQMRTSDSLAFSLVKDDAIDGLQKPYLVKHEEPDGTGMSVVFLKL